MSLDFKTLPAKILPLLEQVKRYLVLIFIVFFVSACSFLVLRVNELARSEPTDEQVSQELQSVKRPKLDQDAVDKIEQLEDQNIEVKTLFDQARKNPFAE